MKYYFLIITALLLFSCENTKNTDGTSDANDTTSIAKSEYKIINASDFNSLAENFIDKEIILEGTCIHACKHGGGKMHIVGTDSDVSVVVMATEQSGKFNTEMEGIKYNILGKVIETRIDSAYLAKKEQELLTGEAESGEGLKHRHDKENEDADATMELEMKLAKLDAIREEIKESKKAYLSNFTFECISFEKIKE